MDDKHGNRMMQPQHAATKRRASVTDKRPEQEAWDLRLEGHQISPDASRVELAQSNQAYNSKLATLAPIRMGTPLLERRPQVGIQQQAEQRVKEALALSRDSRSCVKQRTCPET